MDRYRKIDSDVDREIFFNYYLGFNSGGKQGYTILKKPGSTAHRRGVGEVYTKNQFRSKGKKLALLANAFLATKESDEGEIIPPMDQRPTFTAEQIHQMIEDRKDKRTPLKKFEDELAGKEVMEFFVFFMYYDGFKSAAERKEDPTVPHYGFNLASGPPGSVNHQRCYTRLRSMVNFRTIGSRLGALAKEFLDQNIEPPEEYRPIEDDPEPPFDMIEEAARLLAETSI